MAFARYVLDKVPAFDVELGPGAYGILEELLFSLQLVAAGYRIKAAFDVCAEHDFDETRLFRASLIDGHINQGRSRAYIDYHWRHRPGRPFPRLRLFMHMPRLAWYRLMHPAQMRSLEGVSEIEAGLITKVLYYRQYLKETKRPHNYEQHGLVKVAGLLA